MFDRMFVPLAYAPAWPERLGRGSNGLASLRRRVGLRGRIWRLRSAARWVEGEEVGARVGGDVAAWEGSRWRRRVGGLLFGAVVLGGVAWGGRAVAVTDSGNVAGLLLAEAPVGQGGVSLDVADQAAHVSVLVEAPAGALPVGSELAVTEPSEAGIAASVAGTGRSVVVAIGVEDLVSGQPATSPFRQALHVVLTGASLAPGDTAVVVAAASSLLSHSLVGSGTLSLSLSGPATLVVLGPPSAPLAGGTTAPTGVPLRLEETAGALFVLAGGALAARAERRRRLEGARRRRRARLS